MKKQIVRVVFSIAILCAVYSIYRTPRLNEASNISLDILSEYDTIVANELDTGSKTTDANKEVKVTNENNAANMRTKHIDNSIKVRGNIQTGKELNNASLSDNGININTTRSTSKAAKKRVLNHDDASFMLDTLSDSKKSETLNQAGKVKSDTHTDSLSDETSDVKAVSQSGSVSDTYEATRNELDEYIFSNTGDVFDRSSISKQQREDEDIFKTFPNYQNETKYLMYYCNVKCGGLADRLKGITMVYMMSLLTKRKFALNMTTPCDLEHFLVPNVLDWRVPPMSEVTGKPAIILDYFERYDAHKIEYMKEDIDPAETMEMDYVWMRSNQDWTRIFRTLSVTHERFPQLHVYHSSDLFRIIYNGLFKPSAELEQHMSSFFKETVGDSKLACLHARMGEADYLRYTMEQILTPLNYLKQFDKREEYKIMVATDNQGVKDLSKDMFKHFIDTSGPILHIDYMLNGSVSDNRKCDGFMRTLVDHMTLRRCDDLVLTSSGFGVTAASLRHTSRGLYIYMKDDKVHPTKKELLREVFQWRCIWRWWSIGLHDYYSNICDG